MLPSGPFLGHQLGMVVANEGGAVPEGLYNWNNGAWHIMAGITNETVTSIMGDFLNGVLT